MKLAECEQKKENYLLLERKINKLPDGPEKRKLIYGRNLRDKEENRKNKTPVDIERQLHESYQMILKVRSCFVIQFKGLDVNSTYNLSFFIRKEFVAYSFWAWQIMHSYAMPNQGLKIWGDE